MSKKADMDKLNNLHNLIADYYAEAIESGEELSSGFLAAVNAFLKNNNVTADISESEPMQDLQNKLRQLMQEDEGDK